MNKIFSCGFLLIFLLVGANHFAFSQKNHTKSAKPPTKSVTVKKKASAAKRATVNVAPPTFHSIRDNKTSASIHHSTALIHSYWKTEVITGGRLALYKSDEKGSVFYPAELANNRELKFNNNPVLFTNKLQTEIFAITTNNELAWLYFDSGWKLNFPGKEAGDNNVRVNAIPSCKLLPGTLGVSQETSVISLTTEGRLIEFGYNSNERKWRINYPAELAGYSDYKLTNKLSQSNISNSSKDIAVITTSGKLLHLWNNANSNTWHGEFPQELCGMSDLKFMTITPAIQKIPDGKGQYIAALTTDGKLVVMTYQGARWHGYYPCEMAQKPNLRFFSLPLMVINKFSDITSDAYRPAVFILDDKNNLTQIYQDGRFRWGVDHPTELAHQDVIFKQNPALIENNFDNGKKTLAGETISGRFATVYDTDKWNVSYPFE